MRGIYLAAHFENAYQTWPVEDILGYLRDLRDDGADTIGLWYDQHEGRAADLDLPGTPTAERMARIERGPS